MAGGSPSGQEVRSVEYWGKPWPNYGEGSLGAGNFGDSDRQGQTGQVGLGRSSPIGSNAVVCGHLRI